MELLIKVFMVVVFWPAILGHVVVGLSMDRAVSERGLLEGFYFLVMVLGLCAMILGTAAYWIGMLYLCGVDMSWLASGGSSRSGGYPIIIPMRF